MSQDELQETLANLHQTLQDASEVDDESRQMLLALMADIQRLLEEREAETPEDESFTEQLRNRIREFEIEHPLIGGLLERLTDGLANLGI